MKQPDILKSDPPPADCTSYLPDLCSVRSVFSIIIVGELLAFIMALGPQGSTGDRWDNLGMISLLIQWVALTCASLLCVIRRHLGSSSNLKTSVISIAVIQITTLVASEAAWWISRSTPLEILLPLNWHFGFLSRNLAISFIVTVVALRYFYLQAELRENIAAESEARLQALQARIRPHFLFNCMNTIASLTRSKPKIAEEVVEDLADLFRVSLSENQHQTTWNEEIELAKRYLNIEKLRLGNRLIVRWDIDTIPENTKLPVLTLQPLLENAVYHGIEPLGTPGEITIKGQVKDDVITIAITNPVSSISTTGRQGNQMALDNVRQRLQMLFDEGAQLRLDKAGSQYKVILEFPYHGARP
ncbi:MAG: sensor histidine kinase [Gammaproteobacteria bacterium]